MLLAFQKDQGDGNGSLLLFLNSCFDRQWVHVFMVWSSVICTAGLCCSGKFFLDWSLCCPVWEGLQKRRGKPCLRYFFMHIYTMQARIKKNTGEVVQKKRRGWLVSTLNRGCRWKPQLIWLLILLRFLWISLCKCVSIWTSDKVFEQNRCYGRSQRRWP